jgi:hypothetical protein
MKMLMAALLFCFAIPCSAQVVEHDLLPVRQSLAYMSFNGHIYNHQELNDRAFAALLRTDSPSDLSCNFYVAKAFHTVTITYGTENRSYGNNNSTCSQSQDVYAYSDTVTVEPTQFSWVKFVPYSFTVTGKFVMSDQNAASESEGSSGYGCFKNYENENSQQIFSQEDPVATAETLQCDALNNLNDQVCAQLAHGLHTRGFFLH